MKRSQAKRRYAPLWISLFSTATAVARVVGERYLLQREWRLKWSDLLTAAVGAFVGYVVFRRRHGNEVEGMFTR